MAKLILRSDTDGDMKIDPSQGKMLALRLKIQLEPHGIDLDAVRFQQLLDDDNDIGSILKFCAEVLYPEAKAKNDVKDLESIASSYEGQSSSEEEDDDFFTTNNALKPQADSFAMFCKKLSMLSAEELEIECDKITMTTEDKLGMFSVSNKYSRG